MSPGFSLTTGGKLQVVVVDIFIDGGLKLLLPVRVQDYDVACSQAHQNPFLTGVVGNAEDLLGRGSGVSAQGCPPPHSGPLLRKPTAPSHRGPHSAQWQLARHLVMQTELLQLLATPQVPGIQSGVFTSRPELIAREVHASGPIFRDFLLPGGKELRGLCISWAPRSFGPRKALEVPQMYSSD